MKLQNLIHTLIGIVCIGLLPQAQAVSPPPDGGYPGGNTAEGQSALLSLTSGFYNTGVGIYSLLSLTTGNFCTGVGAGTLLCEHRRFKYCHGRRSAFQATPPARATRPMGHSPSLPTRKAATIQPSVLMRYLAILRAAKTRPSAFRHSKTTQSVSTTPPLVFARL